MHLQPSLRPTFSASRQRWCGSGSLWHKRSAAASGDSPFIVIGSELRLSNRGQLELLRAVTEHGASLRATMLGYSMAPSIRDGDVLTIEPMPDREPRLGEVIAFADPDTGRMRVHRVVGCEPPGWTMQGDNSLHADGIILREWMAGRVVRVERAGRVVEAGTQGGSSAVPRRGPVRSRVVRLTWEGRRIAAAVMRRLRALRSWG